LIVYDIKPILKSSEKNLGASTLVLQVSEKNISGFISVDNRGTEASGPVQVTQGFTISNPVGYFSSTNVIYATTTETKELGYLSLDHSETINSEGTKLRFSVINSKSSPGTELLESVDQKSNSKTVSVTISHPIIRSRQKNISLYGSLVAKNSESFTLGEKISEDKLRVIRLGVNFDYADSFGATNQVLLEYSHGLKGIGASDNTSTLKTRADGLVDFNKATLYLSRTQTFSNWQLHTALNSQYSKDALLSGEECGIGGKQFGRAYDSSELSGEHCIALGFEARYPLGFRNNIVENIQAYAFLDVGQVKNIGVLESENLASTGTGLRFGFAKNISGSIELAKPLTREVANQGNKKPRLFASLSMNF